MPIFNSIVNFVRILVSGDKRRFQEQGFDLDLTYITDRIIATSFPASGFEGYYRNHIQDVAKMLNTIHKDHYRIYNLSERKYNYTLFHNRVVEFGFPDHHSPPIEYLFEICEDMDRWLNENPKNVCVVHCLAGRGRTGTVIACYLTYNGLFDNGSEALDFFAGRRTYTERGVSHPSQRSEILHGRKPKKEPLKLKRITMYMCPIFENNGCRPIIEIYTAPTQFNEKKLLHSTKKPFDQNKFFKDTDGMFSIDINIELQGDVYIRCYHLKSEKTKVYMFRVSFHTGFVPSGSVLRLTKTDLDDAIKSPKFDRDFFMDLEFEKIKEPNMEQNLEPNLENELKINIQI